MEIEYRVVGVNLAPTNAPNTSEVSKQLNMPEDYLKKEFPKQYVQNRNINTALQCQAVLNMYGKFGWNHYQQAQLGNQAMLYFKRDRNTKKPEGVKLDPQEEAIIQKLDPEQKPY